MKTIVIIGAGLAGSEAALQLAERGFAVRLYEMRPEVNTPVHKTAFAAELVCSNSLKSTKPDSAAGMLKSELQVLGSQVYAAALRYAVAAGGALAVDRDAFAEEVTLALEAHPHIELIRHEVRSFSQVAEGADALVLATGALTSDALAEELAHLTGSEHLAFFDAAAPIVMADSLDMNKLFRQSRYEDGTEGAGDYLNAPFTKEEYDAFIEELIAAKRVMQRSFETRELFQACQPIEEIARKGHDAPRFGALKPVGLTDPRTGKRPWAVLQLRAENAEGTAFNLVGFQTNLTFGEQHRAFRMIPGLEEAEFARYGVMHRNTFVNAPQLLDNHLQLQTSEAKKLGVPLYLAGQIAGTEGYCEAIRSGLHVACAIAADLEEKVLPKLPLETAFGALLAYATNPETKEYQPMHVNFGILPPFEKRIRNKRERYAAYAERGNTALKEYVKAVQNAVGLPFASIESSSAGDC